MPLFSSPDHSAFSIAMSSVAFVMLAIFMTATPMITHGVSIYLPEVHHPKLMPAADREDALIIAVIRDGKLFFRTDQITLDTLSARLNAALPETSQRVIYIRADGRARYGEIKLVLDAIHNAKIQNVAFLVD